MLRAVIFDFDGLILDTESPEYQSWCEIYASHGHTLAMELWIHAIGTRGGFDPHEHLEGLTGKPLDREELRRWRRARNEELLSVAPLLEGVEERLDEAKALGLRVAIASSADSDWVHGHLQRYSIRHRFEAVKCAGDGIECKPAPALYLAALAAVGVEAHEAVAFEDSRHGVDAARAAGIYCIAVPNQMTKGMDFSPANGVVSSLNHVSLTRLAEEWKTAGAD